MFWFDLHFHRIVIVGGNFTCIAFTYHVFELGVGYLLAGTTSVAGK